MEIVNIFAACKFRFPLYINGFMSSNVTVHIIVRVGHEEGVCHAEVFKVGAMTSQWLSRIGLYVNSS